MPEIRRDAQALDGEAATGDVESGGELVSPGIWAGPFAGLFDAGEIALAKSLVGSWRGGCFTEERKRDAAFAAIHTYRALYGNAVGSSPPPLLVADYNYWFRRLGEGHPLPRRLRAALDQQAPAVASGDMTDMEANEWYSAKADQWSREG